MSSFDLTPPISPVLEMQELTCHSVSSTDCVPWFSCTGSTTETYLGSNNFQMYLYSQLQTCTMENSIDLFGAIFSTDTSFWNEKKFLIAEIKKSFFIIQTYATGNTNMFPDEDSVSLVHSLRKSVCKTFDYFLSNLHLIFSKYSYMDSYESFMDSYEDSFLSSTIPADMVKVIKHLLVFIGQISSIPKLIHMRDFKDSSQRAKCFYHYVHLCLDVWWYSVAILQTVNAGRIKMKVFCDDLNQSDPFSQVTSLLLNDFICMAIHSYNFNSFSICSPFKCKCFQDFWIMLINVLDKRYSVGEDSFWSTYCSTVQNILNPSSNKKLAMDIEIPKSASFNNQMEFDDISEPCLWLTSHIASLYKYDEYGDYCEFKTPKSGYMVIKPLIHKLLANSSNEKILRHSLFYVMQLITIWEASCEVILPLTDFYIKKLDEMFCLPGIEIQGLSYLFKNSTAWFQYINNLSNTCATLGKESSFDMYLHIITIQLKKDSAGGSLWRALKGRVYSKFMPKKVKELSEVGLQNSFSLFLAIAESGQLEVTVKICDLASVIETSSSFRKQTISWKALFVLMHIYQKKGYMLNKIVTKITNFFNDTCSKYSAITKDSMHKSDVMNLLLVYIDSMSEIFEQCNNLKLSEYQLIGSGFATLLSSCGVTEINYVLNIFLTILAKVQTIVGDNYNVECDVVEMQYTRFLEFILNHIFPFVQKISITDTPPVHVSDIAAALTDLCYKFESSLADITSLNFCSIFIHFGSKDTVNISIMCRYLCFILDDASLLIGLKEKIPNFSLLIFNSWLRCTINLSAPSNQMQEFTAKSLLQKDLVAVFPGIRNLNLKSADHIFISISLFRVMGETYEANSDLQFKNQLRLKMHSYFKNYVACVATRIMKNCDGPTLDHVYKLTSHLVEYCSPLLHMKFNSESILPQLIDKTVIPHIVFPKDKHSQGVLSCSIKEYLPSFIRGLFKLDYRKDKCIEREIKDVMVNYICIYSTSNNPIIKLFIDTVNCRPEGLKPETFVFLLEVIKVNMLLNYSVNARNGYELCFEVLKFTPLANKAEVINVLLTSALEVYMKQGNFLSDYLRDLIKKLLIYFKEKMELNYSKKILIPILQWFIREKLQWSSARGFSVLDSVTEFLPGVLLEMVSFLNNTVEELERNRGSGKDGVLHNYVRLTITKLQQKLPRDTTLGRKN